MWFRNANIFREKEGFMPGDFLVEEGSFKEIRLQQTGTCGDGVDLKGLRVIPGLIDIHTHGNSGADFSDADPEGLQKMGLYLAARGITSFAPTSMTLPAETLRKAFGTALAYTKERPAKGARVAGINMEGPFFSEKKKGAQNGAYLRLPDYELVKELYDSCEGLLRIVDVAPELPGAEEFIRKTSQLCTVSVAHTDASYEEAKAGFEAGATHVTHLFNAMPSLHHRKPGVIGAAAEREDVAAELICDGLHVHPSVIRLAFRLFPERICMISDSLRCCGMPDGEYELGGQQVFLKDHIARLADGTIAGAASDLFEGLKNVISFGIPEEQAVRAATIIPAREIGREKELGSIEPGKLADFVVCDDAWNIHAVYIGGEKI